VTDAAVSSRGTDLRATIEVAAAPEDVWPFITDLRAMSQRSPQVQFTRVLPEPVRLGSLMFNVNRSSWKLWTTTGRVVRYQPFDEFAFRIFDNRVIWSYRLEPTEGGTRIVHQRETPNGIGFVSRALTRVMMGGQDAFYAEILEGMAQTLEAFKADIEDSLAA
jgi:hypothetical protein